MHEPPYQVPVSVVLAQAYPKKSLAFSYVLYLVSLCLGTPPVITVHPMDVAIQLHSNLSFYSVVLYNWERQNDVISSDSTGVNINNFTLINLQPEDAGNYRCVATNASGSSVSNYIHLTYY